MNTYPFTLPEIKISYKELSPYISEKAMKLHHQKHQKAYIDKLNETVENDDFLKELSLEQIISKETLSKVSEEKAEKIRNFGGGYFNHIMFFNILVSKKKKTGKMFNTFIKKDFGSFEDFKKEFNEKSNSHFGSGWCWAVIDDGMLKIETTKNQDNPINFKKCKPILGIDLWEHAYYLDYNNRKKEYIEKFLDHIDWEEVENYILEEEGK
jgi:Fe-Mn family superoxide dismutase